MAVKTTFSSDKDLKKDFKEGLKPIYVFFGEEGYLRRYYTEKLKELVVTGELLDFNYHVFEGKDFDREALFTTLLSIPFGSKGIFVVVKDLYSSAMKGDFLVKIEEAMGETAENTTLLFLYEDQTYSFPSGTEEKKLSQIVQKYGRVVEFQSPGDLNLMDWVRRRAKAGGKTISQDTVKYLLSYCDRSMDNLANEIEKLSLGVKGEEIQIKDIDAFCVRDPDAKGYRLADLYLKNDIESFSRELSDLIAERNEPLMLLAAFSKAIRSAFDCKLYAKQGFTAPEIARKLGIRDFIVKNTLTSANKTSETKLEKVLSSSIKTDILLKSSRLNNYEILKNFFMECFFL